MITMEDVWRTYSLGGERINALAGVDLSVNEGEFVAIVGPSGSGKTTLLNIIGGLDVPSQGKVSVDGQELSRAGDRTLSAYRNRKVGIVFQNFHLQPTYTALENVALPLVFAGVPRKARLRRAAEVLEAVELSARSKHLPNQLSAGERQRVAIGRAIVNQPRIVLADEPTGNLDSRTSSRIIKLLIRLIRDRNLTMLLVTHDSEVAQNGDRTVSMLDGQIVRV